MHCQAPYDSRFMAMTAETSHCSVSSIVLFSPMVRVLLTVEPAASLRSSQLGLSHLTPGFLGRTSSARFLRHDLLITTGLAIPSQDIESECPSRSMSRRGAASGIRQLTSSSMDKLFTTRTSSLFSVSFWNFATVCPVWMIRVSWDRLDIAIRVLPSPSVWYPFSANNPRQFAGRLCVVIHPSWVPVARGLSFAVTQSTVVCVRSRYLRKTAKQT